MYFMLSWGFPLNYKRRNPMINKKNLLLIIIVSMLLVGFSTTLNAEDNQMLNVQMQQQQSLAVYFHNKPPSSGLNEMSANQFKDPSVLAFCPENNACRFDWQCGAGFCFAPYSELGLCVCF